MEKKKLLYIVIAIIIVATIGIVAYTTFIPNEDRLWDEKMSLIDGDVKNISEEIEKRTNDNSSEYNQKMIKDIEVMCNMINNKTDEDLKILNELNNSITDPIRKEYLGLGKQDIEYLREFSNLMTKINNLEKDFNDDKISISEFTNKSSEFETEYNTLIKNIDNNEQKLKEYEDKYPQVSYNKKGD